MGKKEGSALTRHNSVIRRFPIRKSELDRFKLGKIRYHELMLLGGEAAPTCLDVACGAKPFPEASVLCDLNARPVPDRRMKKLVTAGKPFVLCDSLHLPFKDKAFDFATSYYLIEHIDDPWILFKELKRVSKHGHIQCPSWLNELFYGEDVHKWILLKREGKLYVKAIENGTRLHSGFIFHKLYQSSVWQIIHAIMDETFHLFTVNYSY